MINLRSSVPPADGRAGMLHYQPAEHDDVRSKVPETAAIGQQLRFGERCSGFRHRRYLADAERCDWPSPSEVYVCRRPG